MKIITKFSDLSFPKEDVKLRVGLVVRAKYSDTTYVVINCGDRLALLRWDKNGIETKLYDYGVAHKGGNPVPNHFEVVGELMNSDFIPTA